MSAAFACPPDCGHCCTHLEREPSADEDAFREMLREHGVYHCADAAGAGLAVSNEEAARLLARAKERRMRVDIHPRTYLLDGRRRTAVILDWHVAANSCPFYHDYKCTVYDARPLVCRAYPVLIASPLLLAPECPKVPAPKSALTAELRAKRTLDRAHAELDAALTAGRFTPSLAPREAAARLKRYRKLTPDEYRGSARP